MRMVSPRAIHSACAALGVSMTETLPFSSAMAVGQAGTP